jgi:Ni,Fe-hydrogenase III large subunit/NADH:ubiquinone oxidoreductase subunit C
MAGGGDNGASMSDSGITETARADACKPWRRHDLSAADWAETARAAAAESRVLLAHWADSDRVYALFLDPDASAVLPISTAVEDGTYPALSPVLADAALYERMIHDLFGHEARGAGNLRPWLDHGAWPCARPMATRPSPPRPEFDLLDSAEQDRHMVLSVGPIAGLVGEAAHLRLTLDGPAIRRAETLLGFTHKGTLSLMRGKSPRTAARFAARLSADSTVAHSIAFAAAAEVALDVPAPPRAQRLRAVMLETERIAVHLDTVAEIGRLTGARSVSATCGALRETVLRACEAAFGHRLMMGCVVPGGVAADLPVGGAESLAGALGHIAARLPELRRQHDGTALASRLCGLGRTDRAAAGSAGGVAARAAGHVFDSRTALMPAYSHLPPVQSTQTAADSAARQAVRIDEIEDSLRLIVSALDTLPAGPIAESLPQTSGEGIACAESSRGDIWHWLRIDHGQIAAAFPRDPGWALWPLAEAALTGAMAEDAEIIRTSLALPASGMDL